jgi:EAL domain-containing protein (putative c-di-GMP-specific phosphodiesterase class I)/CheY-like chemotaxis protein
MTESSTRILVVDDDLDLTLAVRVALEAEGYDVLVANSGKTGLELAHTHHPHLILLDAAMPDMDGYQVCRELQFGYTKDIPVVFLTARRDLSDMQAASLSGASGYITKPFRIERLLESVRDLLRDALVFEDDVTGLPTLSHVQVEVQRRLYGHSQLGMLYVSLDGVWPLEQTQGFEVVDQVFRVVGRQLAEARGTLLRSEDFVSVSSLGNAFLVVLSPPRDRGVVLDDHVLAVKRRLERQLLDGLEQELERELFAKIGLYVGYARLTQSPKVRFRRALLEAVNAAVRSIEEERSEAQHRLRRDFETILAERQITCVYQPIVKLGAFEVIGYELLARGPAGTELHRPDALFEVARNQGRVADLDRVCRMAAARGSESLPSRYLRFINTEPVSLFFHSRSQDYIREFIDATPSELRPRTVIEITENAIIEDFEHMRGILNRMRGEGFLIAIDDAGAGYSGLQTMVEVQSDFIKLDMCLTRNIEDSIVKQRLVKTLRDFCESAQIVLVAEGIETPAQLDVLQELGVECGQGFLFALPGSPFPLQETILPGEGRPGPSLPGGLFSSPR